MMVINKAETQEGISLIFIFLTAIRTVPYCWQHRSTSIMAKWQCGVVAFVGRKQYIYASQTICLRGVNVFFTTRKRAICGFKARGMARLLPPQTIWCDWKS